jgi:hypothetical protein
MASNVKRIRLTIDLPFELKRRLRVVAAHRNVSLRDYVLDALEERLTADWVGLAEQEGLATLIATGDPALTELWDNERDAAYDSI